MENTKDMQAATKLAAIQASTMVVREMREKELPAESHTRRSSLEETCRPRQTEPTLSQPAFDWKAPDRYVELLNFEIKVATILQAKVSDLTDEEKVSTIKNCSGKEGFQFIQTLTNTEKEVCKVQQDYSLF